MKWFRAIPWWIAFVVSGSLACASSDDASPAPEPLDTSTSLVLDSNLIGKPFQKESANATYWAGVGKPTRYLTDYYGLHVLQPMAKEAVLHDLVPAVASVAEDRGNSLALLLEGSYPVIFHFHKDLRGPDGTVVDSGHDYALFDSPDAERLLGALDAFHGTLETRDLSKTYLIPNHRFDLEESAAAAQAAAADQRVGMIADPDRTRFRAAGADALLVVPDAVHGNEARYARILDILQHESLDWFGIEMYERSVQPAIDAFLSEPEGSPAFATAKQVLLDASWKGKFPPGTETKPEDNHYFRLLDVCRTRKIRAHGMDIDRFYDLWGHGETPFGAMVRNSFWVAGLPPSGRGVVFGGSAHFRGNATVGGRPTLFVQDFLAPVYRGERLFVFPEL